MLLIVGSFKKMTTFATANEKDWFLGCCLLYTSDAADD